MLCIRVAHKASRAARGHIRMPLKQTSLTNGGTSSSLHTKRSISPTKDTRPLKTQRSSRLDDDLDLINETDFDADALHEAAMAAEDEGARTQSSQASAAAKELEKRSSSSQNHNTPSKQQNTASQATQVSLSSTSNARHCDLTLERETMEPEWYERLKQEMDKEYFVALKQFLQSELKAGKTIYPPAPLVHSWSRLTPLRSVKVVVVGQDPYHGPGQACGHSFSVPKGVAVPGSLQNIYKELRQEYGDAFTAPKHGCLDAWAQQGVLLLNACLTVSARQAGSHHNKGWEPFTQTILRIIAQDAAKAPKASIKQSTIASMFSKQSGAKSDGAAGDVKKCSSDKAGNKGVVFLAWGLPAAKTLAAAGITEKSPNILLLKSPHPSPLSAHRGFLGNGHFKQANEWLQSEARYGPNGGIQWEKL